NAFGSREVEELAAGVAHFIIGPDSGALPTLRIAEHPNQLTAEEAEKRMIDEIAAPVGHGHVARGEVGRLDASALCCEGLLDLFPEGGDQANLFRECFLDV